MSKAKTRSQQQSHSYKQALKEITNLHLIHTKALEEIASLNSLDFMDIKSPLAAAKAHSLKVRQIARIALGRCPHCGDAPLDDDDICSCGNSGPDHRKNN